MKKKSFPYVFFITCFCIIACRTEIDSTLDRAEVLMSERADSSLLLLNSISTGHSSTRQLARYSLLKTIAQHKCLIDVEDDSLIHVAYDYYSRRGSSIEKMKASYYRGVIKQNAEEVLEATLYLKEAEKIAEKEENNLYLGLICEKLSELFAINYDHAASLSYARKAAHSFDAAGQTLSGDFSRTDIARQLYFLGQTTKAEHLTDSLLQKKTTTDSGLEYLLFIQKANLCFDRGEYNLSENYYRKAHSLGIPLSIRNNGQMALICEKSGDSAAADSIMAHEKTRIQNTIDSTIYYVNEYLLAASREDFRKAYNSLLMATTLQDAVIQHLLSRSVVHAQNAYLEQQIEIEKERAHTKSVQNYFVVSFVILLLIVTSWSFKKRNEHLLEAMSSVTALSEELEVLQGQHDGIGRTLAVMVQNKTEMMQKLADAYFAWSDDAVNQREYHHGRQMKDEIISDFRRQLKSLRNDDRFLPSLEKSLNISDKEIMTTLRSTFTKEKKKPLKEQDIQLLALLFSGFSIKSISFLTDMSEASIRTRKTRYKQLFRSLNSSDGEWFEKRLS